MCTWPCIPSDTLSSTILASYSLHNPPQEIIFIDEAGVGYEVLEIQHPVALLFTRGPRHRASIASANPAHIFAAVESIVYAPALSRPSTVQFMGRSGLAGNTNSPGQANGFREDSRKYLGHLYTCGGPRPQRLTGTTPTSRLSLDCLSGGLSSI